MLANSFDSSQQPEIERVGESSPSDVVDNRMFGELRPCPGVIDLEPPVSAPLHSQYDMKGQDTLDAETIPDSLDTTEVATPRTMSDGDVENPLTPELHPQLPLYGWNDDPLLKPVEVKAYRLLLRTRPPTPDDILTLFKMMPRASLRRRGGADGETVNWYLVGGCNPRCNKATLTFCTDAPYATLVINRFIRATAPTHPFSKFLLRIGAVDKPHRDTKNGPFPTMIMNLHEGSPKEGLWLQDPLGTVPQTHLGKQILGTVVNLKSPFFFNARKTLHAGYVQNARQAQDRVTLVAFTSLNVGNIDSEVRTQLLDLNFPLPEKATTHSEDQRSLQWTISEAVCLSPSCKDVHDVIEVLDSQA